MQQNDKMLGKEALERELTEADLANIYACAGPTTSPAASPAINPAGLTGANGLNGVPASTFSNLAGIPGLDLSHLLGLGQQSASPSSAVNPSAANNTDSSAGGLGGLGGLLGLLGI